jgi:hypothetical protein
MVKTKTTETAKPGTRTATIRLGDGRLLGFTEWGYPHGTPVLEFRGLPAPASATHLILAS